ncbi:hypothetical protein ACFO4N_00025 [Camelliibacillus cellulosilyticus]|uniref:Spore germination protein N-terminal domain-containing protein n=1 Tax=Camelliibacillus cellulosilyticus TaxID=2174486 RepID=A0ABV9GFK2_9BACL
MTSKTDFKRWKRIVMGGCVILVSLTLSGCWSSTEVNNLAIINTIGIDENKAGEIELSAAMIKPKNVSSPSESSGSEGVNETGALIETVRGRTAL